MNWPRPQVAQERTPRSHGSGSPAAAALQQTVDVAVDAAVDAAVDVAVAQTRENADSLRNSWDE